MSRFRDTLRVHKPNEDEFSLRCSKVPYTAKSYTAGPPFSALHDCKKGNDQT
jgi:hypothetical protein